MLFRVYIIQVDAGYKVTSGPSQGGGGVVVVFTVVSPLVSRTPP